MVDALVGVAAGAAMDIDAKRKRRGPDRFGYRNIKKENEGDRLFKRLRD